MGSRRGEGTRRTTPAEPTTDPTTAPTTDPTTDPRIDPATSPGGSSRCSPPATHEIGREIGSGERRGVGSARSATSSIGHSSVTSSIASWSVRLCDSDAPSTEFGTESGGVQTPQGYTPQGHTPTIRLVPSPASRCDATWGSPRASLVRHHSPLSPMRRLLGSPPSGGLTKRSRAPFDPPGGGASALDLGVGAGKWGLGGGLCRDLAVPAAPMAFSRRKNVRWEPPKVARSNFTMTGIYRKGDPSAPKPLFLTGRAG